MQSAQVEVLYNSVCPVCEAGACELRARIPKERPGLILTDVSKHPEALARAGVSLDQVRFRMHAITPDGRVVRGMKATTAAWIATPSYRMLGRVFEVWPLTWIGALGYNIAAVVLWWWNRANGRW